jgi:hypothetical protein
MKNQYLYRLKIILISFIAVTQTPVWVTNRSETGVSLRGLFKLWQYQKFVVPKLEHRNEEQ